MYRKLLIGFLAILFTVPAYAQFGEGTDNLTDLQDEATTTKTEQTSEKPESTEKVVEEDKKDQVVEDDTEEVEEEIVLPEGESFASVISLTKQFYIDANNEKITPILQKDDFQALKEKSKTRAGWFAQAQSPYKLHASGGIVGFSQPSVDPLNPENTAFKQVFQIDFFKADWASAFVEYTKTHTLTLIMPDVQAKYSTSISLDQIMVAVNGGDQGVYFLPSLLGKIDDETGDGTYRAEGFQIDNSSYENTLKEIYENYLEEKVELFDDEYEFFDEDEKDQEQNSEIKEYCTQYPESGKILCEATKVANDQVWHCDLDAAISTRIMSSCYARTLWNEFMHQRFIRVMYDVNFKVESNPNNEIVQEGIHR